MDEQRLVKNLGQALRRRRKLAGLTIQQLADLAGIDSGFLAYIETGRKTPSLLTAAKLARALDVKLGSLFEDAPDDRGRSYRLDRQVHSLLHDRTPSQQDELIALLRALHDPKTVSALRHLIRR